MSDKKQAPTGAARAAAFLLSIDRVAAQNVIKHLDQRVVSEVAAAMTELGDEFTDSSEIDRLYRDMVLAINSKHGVQAAGEDELRGMLEAAFGPDGAQRTLDTIHERRRHERPFMEVEAFPPELVSTVLVDEPPSAVALVLTHVDPGIAAGVISTFDDDFALEVVTRMATVVPPGIETLHTIAAQLVQKLQSGHGVQVSVDTSARLRTIAEMLHYTTVETERSLLQALENEDDEMVSEIREYMFTWANLSEVDKRSMQKILASIDTRTLAVALKACPAEVEDNVIGNLSERVKDMVLEERELAGPVPMPEVEAARQEVLRGVHALIDSGEFQPMRGGADLVA